MRSAVTRPGSREPSITPNWMPSLTASRCFRMRLAFFTRSEPRKSSKSLYGSGFRFVHQAWRAARMMNPAASKWVASSGVPKATFTLSCARSDRALSARSSTPWTRACSRAPSQAAVSRRRPQCGVKGTPTKSRGQWLTRHLRAASIHSESSQNSPSLCIFRYSGTAPTRRPFPDAPARTTMKRGCQPSSSATQPDSSRPARKAYSRKTESSGESSPSHPSWVIPTAEGSILRSTETRSSPLPRSLKHVSLRMVSTSSARRKPSSRS
mmetsp:Transcript_61044/g.132280  ORF Transcript_61044/g.132280 Transcript_61044/m.132280 type:complete len:267 (+) Transcript_61044:599-1399(+)